MDSRNPEEENSDSIVKTKSDPHISKSNKDPVVTRTLSHPPMLRIGMRSMSFVDAYRAIAKNKRAVITFLDDKRKLHDVLKEKFDQDQEKSDEESITSAPKI